MYEFDASISAIRWLGGVADRLSDGSQGAFQWTDGTVYEFTNFLEGDPNDLNGKEECIAMGHVDAKPGEWNDARCAARRKYVCKRPSTGEWSVLIIGGC